jgi:hypothetical protein
MRAGRLAKEAPVGEAPLGDQTLAPSSLKKAGENAGHVRIPLMNRTNIALPHKVNPQGVACGATANILTREIPPSASRFPGAILIA